MVNQLPLRSTARGRTVLFYYALIGDAWGLPGHLAIGAGFVIGCVVC